MGVKEQYRDYVMTGFVKRVEPVVADHGDGALLYDADGTEYIDCFAGISVTNAGHHNRKILDAAIAQAEKLVHACSYVYHVESVGALAEKLADMVVTTHVCRGNFRSTWISSGGYEPVAETLLGKLDIDGYFLEYDTERAGGFEPLRFVPRGDKIVVLGLVTSKTGALESKDELKRRIEAAAKYLPLEQLALSPQCGFASTEEGNVLAEDEQWAKLRMIVELAEEVWGK